MKKKGIIAIFLLFSNISFFSSCKKNSCEPVECNNQNTDIEDETNKDIDDAEKEAGEDEDLIFVTEYVLDPERKYSGYLNKNNKPHKFGTLTWTQTACVYTGEFNDGLYEGSGVFEWRNEGNTYFGKFEKNEPTFGMLRYANTMRYIGEFKNWNFDGKGIFDWNTYENNGALKSAGWLYEGEFKNGTMAGCRGKVTFKRSGNEAAVYWFEGEMNGFPSVKPNQKGKAKIVYPDKSSYEGEVYYNGSSYLRDGYGVQDFFAVGYSGAEAGGNSEYIIDYYEGQFVQTGWMSGDGVVYFCDSNRIPKAYITGIWDGFNKIGIHSNKENIKIREEYKNCEEIEFANIWDRKLEGYINENPNLNDSLLLVGPSTFEFWKNYATDLSGLNPINFGIGGTGPRFWKENVDEIKTLNGTPKNILYACGTNDLYNYAGRTAEEIATDAKEVLDKLHEAYPNAKIYVQNNVLCKARWDKKADYEKINSLISEYCSSKDYLNEVNIISLFYTSEAVSEYVWGDYGYLKTDMFVEDNLHFNADAYAQLGAYLKTIIS